MRQGFESIQKILNQTFRYNPSARSSLKRGLIWEKWEEIVGKDLAEHCQPAGHKNGYLYIHVKDSSWAEHLKWFKRKILTKIHELTGEAFPKELLFRVGSLEPNTQFKGNAVAEAQKKDTELLTDQALFQQIDSDSLCKLQTQIAKEVEDPDLLKAILRVEISRKLEHQSDSLRNQQA